MEHTKHSKHNFIDGGQHVVKDLVLTMNQAMGPVQERVTKIHDTYGKEETKVTVESSVEKKDFMRVKMHNQELWSHFEDFSIQTEVTGSNKKGGKIQGPNVQFRRSSPCVCRELQSVRCGEEICSIRCSRP
ncbi:hypothetical protein F2Q69_00005556 [Brassica cretica]|uniref:Uncharacterized protein n=1 Tax=Brassica cretica TaxID=69181 RepID=A0A8S9P5V9_BRACR|nr:hypothetical protein F2Q69_00005556 [Brassica cretica]